MVKTAKERAIAILQRKKDSISQLQGLDTSDTLFKTWKRGVEVAIENIFGDGRHLKDFRAVVFYPSFVQSTLSGTSSYFASTALVSSPPYL